MDAHRHPANIARHDEQTFGGRAADRVAAFMGSWHFIGIQTAVIVAWIGLNVAGMEVWHWDKYPFILLNLLFSTQAAYAALILQLAQNRQSEHDRLKAEHDYETNQHALVHLKVWHRDAHGADCACVDLPNNKEVADGDGQA